MSAVSTHRGRAVALAVAVLVALAVVAGVLVLRADDEPTGATLRGDTGRGFPLRGPLAADAEAMDDAVSAWRDAEDGPPRRADVSVLWIGRGEGEDEDVAILTGRRRAAEVVRAGDGDWRVRATAIDDSQFRGGEPVGVGQSVLVPEGDLYGWRGAGDGPEPVETNGRFAVAGTRGFLRGAPPPPGEVSVMWGIEIGAIAVDRETAATLSRVLAGPMAEPLWAAVRAADARIDEDLGSPARYGTQYLEVLDFDPYVAGEVTIALDRPPGLAIAVGHAGGAEVLGYGSVPGHPGAVAAGAVELDGVPYAIIAGVDTPYVQAEIDGERVSAPGPAAVLEQPNGELPDVKALGEKDVVVLDP